MENVNLEKVKKAVDLQKSMNDDIDRYGQTTDQKCKELDSLIDNFNKDEADFFIKLYFEKC